MKEQFTLKLQSDLNCMGIKRTDPACNSDISCKSIFCNDQKYLITVQCGLLQRTHYQIIDLKKGKIIKNWKSGYSCHILDIIQTDKDNILFVNFKQNQVNITLLWNLLTLTIFKMFKENLLNINIRAIIDFKIICYIRKDSNQDSEENQLILRIIDVQTFRQSMMASCIKVKQDFKIFNNGVAAFSILKGIKIFY